MGQHAVAVGKTKSGDNNHQVIAPSNWRFISGDLDGDVKKGYREFSRAVPDTADPSAYHPVSPASVYSPPH